MRELYTIGQYRTPRSRVAVKVWADVSNDAARSLREARAKLEAGQHHCAPLQAAWRRAGAAAFRFEVRDRWTPSEEPEKLARWRAGLRLDDRRKSFLAMARERKGRAVRPGAKLTSEQVIELFRRRASGADTLTLEAEFRVPKTTVRQVLGRRIYRSVTVPDGLLEQCAKVADGLVRTLSHDQVKDIRRRLAAGEKMAAISEACGVSRFTVTNVLHGRSYADVNDEAVALALCRQRARREGRFATRQTKPKEWISAAQI